MKQFTVVAALSVVIAISFNTPAGAQDAPSHTDGEREWAYDRKSNIGALDKAWDEAQAKGWTIVDMKRDWKKVYAFE
jgi:hypothetical protein